MRAAHNTAALVALALAVAACSQGSTNTATATIAGNIAAPPSPSEIYALRERCAKDAVEALKGYPKRSPRHTGGYEDHYDLATNDCYMLTDEYYAGAKGVVNMSFVLSSVSEG
jgi:ABC-type glycerol-3-phosphate transport system substrate-binding protein